MLLPMTISDPSFSVDSLPRRAPVIPCVVGEPSEALRRGVVDWSSWYLTDEEDVGESPKQGEIIRLLIALLKTWVREREISGAYVGGDNFFAWMENEPLVRVSPDAFVLLDAPQPLPPSFQTWQPGIQAPLIAVEIVSEDWQKDYALGPEKYERLGVQELVIFDPDAAGRVGARTVLQIYRRTEDGLFVRMATGAGPLWSEALDAAFVVTTSARGSFLRLAYDAAGRKLLPTRAEAEAQRAEAEAKRADAAELELARLRAELARVRGPGEDG